MNERKEERRNYNMSNTLARYPEPRQADRRATLAHYSGQLEVSRLMAENERLRGALGVYGIHFDTCAMNVDPFHEADCDCGLEAALSGAKP